MRIFPATLDVDDLEGFSEKDIFQRAPIARGLSNVVSKVKEPLVIAVDAPWGGGKTTFLKMWAGELRKEGFPVVFFDAFENDFVEDPFASMAGAVITMVRDSKNAKKSTAKRLVEKATGAGKAILRGGVKTAAKIATLNALDNTILEEVAGDIAKDVQSIADAYIAEIIVDHDKQKSAIAEFKAALSELPSLLSSPDGDEVRPLILIIDELDRCRPQYALQLLERMKHFFSVENVHFVLGVHMGQLRNSVCSVYGRGVDAHLYLQKFISLHLPLVSHPRGRADGDEITYIRHLCSDLGIDYGHNFVDVVRLYCSKKRSSLRSIERIMTCVALALAVAPERFFGPPPIVAGLCILKAMRPDLFAKAKSGSLALEDVSDEFQFATLKDDPDRYLIEDFVEWWEYCLDSNANPLDHEGRQAGMVRHGIRDRFSIVPLIANAYVDRMVAG